MSITGFPKKLVNLGPTLSATHNVWYGEAGNIVKSNLYNLTCDIHKIEEELQLKNHHFIFRKLPKDKLGLTYPTTCVTYIDPRRKSYAEIRYTIVHESIHLKQIQDGDLKWSRKDMTLIWKGTPVYTLEKYTIENIDKYCALPWEEDVSRKQYGLYHSLFKEDPPAIKPKGN